MTWELPGETPGPKRRPGEKKTSKKDFLPPGAHFDTFSALFFRASWILKKRGPGAPSKPDQVFGRFGGLPGGPQEGSRLDGSSIFTFAAGPKKGSKMGAKMEPVGLPNPNYTNFKYTI